MVFASFGDEMVLMAKVTSHGSRIGMCDEIWDFKLIKKRGISIPHILVSLQSHICRMIEGVEVFHEEFFSSEKALPGAALITIFSSYRMVRVNMSNKMGAYIFGILAVVNLYKI
jgi:hypothetical protein